MKYNMKQYKKKWELDFNIFVKRDIDDEVRFVLDQHA
jgi:hypothetical protein